MKGIQHMTSKSVFCPSCGEKIQLDTSKEFGFCMHCGTKIAINESVQNVKIDSSDNIENLLDMAVNELKSGNGAAAYEYANQALTLNPSNSRAWLIRMESNAAIATFGDLRTEDIKTCGRNAIEYSDNKLVSSVYVYDFYLRRADLLCSVAVENISKIKEVEDENSRMLRLGISDRYKVLSESDSESIKLYQNLMLQGLDLILNVPNEEFNGNQDYEDIVFRCAHNYAKYQAAYSKRIQVYGYQITQHTVDETERILGILKKLLPEEKAELLVVKYINKVLVVMDVDMLRFSAEKKLKEKRIEEYWSKNSEEKENLEKELTRLKDTLDRLPLFGKKEQKEEIKKRISEIKFELAKDR
jgi:DNA-directed RNA polymerase subunit RPC12/RpoP